MQEVDAADSGIGGPGKLAKALPKHIRDSLRSKRILLFQEMLSASVYPDTGEATHKRT